MSNEKAIDYSGKRATVTWHGQLCIHIGECGRAKGDLFVSGRRAWQGTKVALCRCGGSNNKPFCDGQHKKTGFTSG